MKDYPKHDDTLDEVVTNRDFQREHLMAFLGWDVLQKYVQGDFSPMTANEIAESCGTYRKLICYVEQRARRRCQNKLNPSVI